MLTRACRGVVMVLAMVAMAAPPTRAQAPLAGYPELTVEVAGLPRAANEAGVQRSELKARMERALRRAVVRVLTRDDMPETVGPVPVLVLTLDLLKSSTLDGTSFTWHLRLDCRRPATTRENGREVTGVLWEQEAMRSAQRALLHPRLNDSLDSLLEAFLNDWRSANPRQP